MARKRATGKVDQRKVQLVREKLLRLMQVEQPEVHGADYFRARRYIQKVLWSLDAAEIERLNDAGLRALFLDALDGLRDPEKLVQRRAERFLDVLGRRKADLRK